MCYSLALVTPLTLSEVRSMLTAGMSADAIGPDAQGPYRRLLDGAQTAVLLQAGRCSCRLVASRFPSRISEDAYLRDRYRALKVPRALVIKGLERHRRGAEAPRPDADALTRLVREHARNAGRAVLILGFAAASGAPSIPTPAVTRRVPKADDAGDAWLEEAMVTRIDP
jgi:hypothetical protein